MTEEEWLEKYELEKTALRCETALDTYFTEKKIGKATVDTLEIGMVYFSTGTILTCNPLIELGDALPFLRMVPAGSYLVFICIDQVRNESYGSFDESEKVQEHI